MRLESLIKEKEVEVEYLLQKHKIETHMEEFMNVAWTKTIKAALKN